MRIAIASSGLGHVARGAEAWAKDTAGALSELSGERPEVVLFSGSPCLMPNTSCSCMALSCLKRGEPLTKLLAKIMPGFTWRWGWKSAYGLEQYTFARSLLREMRERPVDIVHTQDVIVAQMLEAARKKGQIKARTILAHGTEEAMECLAGFGYLQELSPPYAVRHSRKVFMIPNFVDTEVFRPAEGALTEITGDTKDEIRARLGVPREAFVIGCVAAVKKGHKRIDYIIKEFAALGDVSNRAHKGHEEQRGRSTTENAEAQRRGDTSLPQEREHQVAVSTGERGNNSLQVSGLPLRCQHKVGQLPSGLRRSQVSNPFLLIAGAKTDESDELVAMADGLAPGHVKFLFDLPREQMPDVYRCMDLYVHPAPEEIFGICLLEAMACAVPVAAHNSEVLKWVVGPGGWNVDVKEDGFLAKAITKYTTELSEAQREEIESSARKQVIEKFSAKAVIPQMLRMYEDVMTGGGKV